MAGATENVRAAPWFRRLLGPELVQCPSANNTELVTVPVESVFGKTGSNLEFIGLFFTPIFASDDDNVTKKLLDLYRRVNERCAGADKAENEGRGGKLEIVQIVLQTNVDCAVTLVDVEETFRKLVKDLPWFALPYRDFQRKARLWRRFRARAAAPSLALLEAASGRVATARAAERLAADPCAAAFPWRPRPALHALRSEPPLLHAADLRPALPHPCATLADDGVVGLYFSANWCPPCKAFTPQLVELYQRVRARGLRFEVVFVSSDRSEQSFEQYARSMPWLALPWEDAARRAELAELFNVPGIPALVLLQAPHGRVLSLDGRALVTDDLLGKDFPWNPKPVNMLNERFASKLQDHPAVILFVEGDKREIEFAESVLNPAAQTYKMKYQPHEDEDYLLFLIGCDNDTSDLLREFVGIDDAVPLLTAIDIPNGHVSIMEDGVEITEETVKKFVTMFLEGTLPTTDITMPDMKINVNTSAI